MNIDDFIYNLTEADVDLVNKLDNLVGHCQINDEDFKLASNEGNFKEICEFVIEVLQNGDKVSEGYIDFIVDETRYLYEAGFCEENDFSSGLYNCDGLYLYAIDEILRGDDYLI